MKVSSLSACFFGLFLTTLFVSIPEIRGANGSASVQSLSHAFDTYARTEKSSSWRRVDPNETRDEGKPLKAAIRVPAEEIPVSDDLSRQIECLALNIYWEAKSEPVLGQIAVAAVTLNRVLDKRYPTTICEVVRQGGQDRLHSCQFSWWCDGKEDVPTERVSWRLALSLASSALLTGLPDPTHGALWYHADYVQPYWARRKKVVARIGRHIFYNYPPSLKRQLASAKF